MAPQSARAFAQQDDAHRFEQDQQIEQQRVVLDVVDVVFELLYGVVDGGDVAMPDLRPTGNARLDAVADRIEWNLFGEHRDEFRPLRTRTDQAHLAAQHVDQLRQFVDARPPYEPADPRDPRVVDGRPRGLAVLFRVHR